MAEISNVDRIVTVLRQRLAERARSSSSARPTASVQAKTPTPLQTVQALAAADDISDEQLGRALVQGLLAEELGAHLVNEAPFQQVVERVVSTIEADETTAVLLKRMLRELRSSVG